MVVFLLIFIRVFIMILKTQIKFGPSRGGVRCAAMCPVCGFMF